MPMALNFRDNVGYENVDLGFSGGLVEGGLGKSKGSKMADVVSSVISGTGQTLASLIGSQTGDLATLAALQVNVVAKSLGTANPHNVIRACLKALKKQNSPKQISIIRNKKISEIIEKRG